MAKDDPHFRLRIPAELKKPIESAAKLANRSINAEIVFRLEEFERLVDELAKAELKIASKQSLLSQARGRLGVVRTDRDDLAEIMRDLNNSKAMEREREYPFDKSPDDMLREIFVELRRLTGEMILRRAIDEAKSRADDAEDAA